MSETTKLQIRMERSLKEAADEVFQKIGLDATTAVRLFVTKVIHFGGNLRAFSAGFNLRVIHREQGGFLTIILPGVGKHHQVY
jgi:hypothetical protein